METVQFTAILLPLWVWLLLFAVLGLASVLGILEHFVPWLRRLQGAFWRLQIMWWTKKKSWPVAVSIEGAPRLVRREPYYLMVVVVRVEAREGRVNVHGLRAVYDDGSSQTPNADESTMSTVEMERIQWWERGFVLEGADTFSVEFRAPTQSTQLHLEITANGVLCQSKECSIAAS